MPCRRSLNKVCSCFKQRRRHRYRTTLFGLYEGIPEEAWAELNGSVPDSVPVQLMRRHYELGFYNREDDDTIISSWVGYDSESSSPKANA